MPTSIDLVNLKYNLLYWHKKKPNITITICSPIGVSSNLWTTLSTSKLFQYSFPFLSFPSACKVYDLYIVNEQKENCDTHVTNSMADWNYIWQLKYVFNSHKITFLSSGKWNGTDTPFHISEILYLYMSVKNETGEIWRALIKNLHGRYKKSVWIIFLLVIVMIVTIMLTFSMWMVTQYIKHSFMHYLIHFPNILFSKWSEFIYFHSTGEKTKAQRSHCY